MASREFLASFAVEIDEGGVTRLQSVPEENRAVPLLRYLLRTLQGAMGQKKTPPKRCGNPGRIPGRFI